MANNSGWVVGEVLDNARRDGRLTAKLRVGVRAAPPLPGDELPAGLAGHAAADLIGAERALAR
jgi:hypothetical protein